MLGTEIKGKELITSDLNITSWEETKGKTGDEWKKVSTRKKVAAPMIFEGSFGGHVHLHNFMG